MVGDSALTVGLPPNQVAHSGGLKVFYTGPHNVGMTAWGYFRAGPKRLDAWMVDDFLPSLRAEDTLESIAQKLAADLNEIRRQAGRLGHPVSRGGFHIGGYSNELPRLWHVHTGHASEGVHELRLYKDFPEGERDPPGIPFSDETWLRLLQNSRNLVHLRNGYHPVFAALFDGIIPYQRVLSNFNIQFPRDTLQSRLEFYKMLVYFIGSTLDVAEAHRGVNTELSWITFNEVGLQADTRIVSRPTPGTAAAELFA